MAASHAGLAMGSPILQPRLDVKPEEEDVPFLHDVLLPLRPQRARLPRGAEGARLHKVGIGDRLGAVSSKKRGGQAEVGRGREVRRGGRSGGGKVVARAREGSAHRMKPFSKSEWITEAAWGAVIPAWKNEWRTATKKKAFIASGGGDKMHAGHRRAEARRAREAGSRPPP